MRKLSKWMWVPLALVAIPSHAEPPVDQIASAAAVAVAGTELILAPAVPFERADLWVAGPEGFVAMKSLPAGPVVSLDLQREGSLPALDERGMEVGKRAVDRLPDGLYRWEAALGRSYGAGRLRGLLVVRAGGLLAPTPRAVEPAEVAVAQPDSAAGGPLPNSLTETELLRLTDANDNGLTLVELQADDNLGARLEEWQIRNDQGDFHIVENGGGGQDEVRLSILQDTANVRVGIGTAAPLDELHVAATFGDSTVRVSGNNASLLLAGADAIWKLTSETTGDLILERNSSIPFSVDENAVQGLLSLVDARVLIGGDLQVSSSRTAKENLVPVEPAEILARVAELPIREWSYKGSRDRHLGPVAEEFHAAFALGASERTLSPTDVSGVALAAIQGLQAAVAEDRAGAAAQLAERDREIALLHQRLDRVMARLASLDTQSECAGGGRGGKSEPGDEPARLTDRRGE